LDTTNTLLPLGFEDFPKIKILVVEDDPIAISMAKIVLVEKGCAVDVVSTGEAAIQCVDESYQLILLDLGLPGINGFEVANTIRNTIGLNIPIVILTTHRDEHNIELARQQGINGYMFKPLTFRKCHLLLVKFLFSKWDKNHFYLIDDEEMEDALSRWWERA